MNRHRFLLVGFFVFSASAFAADWQWSVPVDVARAFLWIPPDCNAVRAVVVAQNNMIEQGILEDAEVRRTLSELGIAEIFVAPYLDQAFDFHHGAGERFNGMMRDLAFASGYSEIENAPVIPMGHSACATFPWNFAAWDPGRTLAILSIHGDAPQTNLTGYGRANIEWGDRSIEGVPGLMVMGEYEWLESRLAPALAFRAAHPNAPLAVLAEPGRGHFDVSRDLVSFLCLFIRKAAAARLPNLADAGGTLRPVSASDGWLVQRWRLDQPRTVSAAPFGAYTGSRAEAFWCFDREMADRTEAYRANQSGKKPQLLGYVQGGAVVPQTATHQQVNLRFEPDPDGITFHVGSAFLATVEGGSPRLPRWTGLPVGAELGHASTPIRLSVITGPADQIDAQTFRVALGRTSTTADRRSDDIWLLAENPGDADYKSAVQQAQLRLRRNRTGASQHLEFVPIPDCRVGDAPVDLAARSDKGLPVGFFVREGPAEVVGNRLQLTAIPPRAKYPVRVTVVAWQFGRPGADGIQEAEPKTQSFVVRQRGEPAVHEAADRIRFGDRDSETAHQFVESNSESIVGGLGEPARRLLPSVVSSWQGGYVDCVMKVDPERQNYATVRFWGSDVTTECLTLFCEDKQIGFRHLGDIDLLDIGGGGPGCLGRFYYNTCPLPLALTQGHSQLHFRIRASGAMWPYGATFTAFQHPMKEPSRGLYSLSVGTEAYYTPPEDERQGRAPADPPVRKGPGIEALHLLGVRVDTEVRKLLEGHGALNQMQNQFLARAYFQPWTAAYRNPHTLDRIIDSLDATYAAFRANPHLAASDPATPNADWFGLGPSGDVLRLVGAELGPRLNAQRRSQYGSMLEACRDWHRRHRRLYSNQTMINDLYGIYLANRGLEVVAPERALPEEVVRRYLYESVGLEAWRNSDAGAADGPPETGGKPWGVGADYWEVTRKGLTKELGFVGYYGEVLDWATSIYNATRPNLESAGDERIRRQLAKLERARAIFRYPDVDDEGNRAMRSETVVGWRDTSHYPGEVTYGERMTWDASALYAASNVLDPEGVGYAQQMFGDNQFFGMLQDRMKDPGFRVTAGLLDVPADYARLRALAPTGKVLPMSRGEPDFVFSDEEDGVVAIKDGDRILYASLYWRAHRAINFLARVHDITPSFDRIAVVREEISYDDSGLRWTRPDTAILPGGGGIKYPEMIHSASAGEVLPIARIPADVPFKPGEESVYAGRGLFYTLRYGPYLIGLNMDASRPHDLETASGPVSVAPRTTVVIKSAADGTERRLSALPAGD